MLSLEVHFNIYPSVTFVAKVSSYASFILPPNESDPFSCCESGHNGTSDCVVAVCVGFYVVFVGWVLCDVSGNRVGRCRSLCGRVSESCTVAGTKCQYLVFNFG